MNTSSVLALSISTSRAWDFHHVKDDDFFDCDVLSISHSI